MKVPDGDHANGQACLQLHMGIGRASRYEQAAQQRGLRRPAAIVGVRRTVQSTFILLQKSRTATMRMGRLACSFTWASDGQAGMSKQRDSADCEGRRRLRESEGRSNRLIAAHAAAFGKI